MSTTKVEGPYRHGTMWRCRVKDEAGRRWCRAAETPEEARRVAEEGIEGTGDRPVVDPPAEATTPSRPPSPMRIEGPFRHGSGYRCRVLTASGPRWCPVRPTRDHAYRMAEQVVSIAMQDGQLSVRQALDAYREHQTEKGNRPASVHNTGQVLRRFFLPVLDAPLHKVTPQKGRDLYDRLCRERSSATGRVVATDTHRNYLAQAKTFLTWCIGQRWIRIHPLEAVIGIGKRRHGKPQLTIDEARSLYKVCFQVADRDDGALAVLLALLLGLRASEITSRTVRDIDDGGRVLRVGSNAAIEFDPKTRAGKRAIVIPEVLRPLLKLRTRHKLPAALLFPTEEGGPHWRDWVAEQTRRFCRQAGLPVVCAHSLRGVAASTAVAAGVAAEAVAKTLGHESTEITRRAYIAPGTLERAERDQVCAVLAGSSMSQSLGQT